MFRIPLPVFGLTLATVALSACAGGTGNGASDPATPPASAGAPAPATDPVEQTVGTCDAAKARSAIGKTATQDVVDAAVAAAGAKGVRVIKPGMAVTMDYREDRLNIDVDAANVVTDVRCG